MLHVNPNQWSCTQQPGRLRRVSLSDQTYMMQACKPMMGQGPSPNTKNDAQMFDSLTLHQRLGSLLLDLQTGSDQVQSVWEMWHDPDSDCPLALVDKPQTAPPPGSPTVKPADIPNEPNENVIKNSEISSTGDSELNLDALHLGDTTGDLVFKVSNQQT